MASNGDISDDVVIALLQRQGLQANRLTAAQTPRRPGTQKPNTSFLKRLVQDTDSHNAALTRKEHEDSRAKLRAWRSHQHSADRDDKKSRHDGSNEGSSDVRSTKRREERADRWANAFKGLGEKQGQRRKREGEGEEPRIERLHKRDRLLPKDKDKNHDDRHVRHRRRSASPVRSRSRSPRRHREREPRNRDRLPERRSSKRSRPEEAEPNVRAPTSRRDRPEPDHTRDEDDNVDSDNPLNNFMVPAPRAPSPQVRGRGAHRVKINRFSPSYNPDTDQTDDDASARRDSDAELIESSMATAILKEKRAERLKAAGFTQEEIEKSELKSGRSGSAGTGSVDKNPENVTWGKRGDDRDWDRGKTVGIDGEWKFEPSWKKGDAMGGS